MTRRARIRVAREWVVPVLITIGFGLLISRAAYLQLVISDRLQAEGNARFLRNIEIKAERGVIKDRNGITLAISTPVDSVWAEPKVLLRHRNKLNLLAQELGIPEDEIALRLKDYAARDRQFIYLKRHLAPHHAEKVMGLKIPGVELMREYKRYYPQAEATANLIGYTNIDDIGQEGIEYTLDADLQGTSGLKRVINDRTGRTVEAVENVRRVVDGQDVQLSIDARIQQIVYKNLLAVVSKQRAALATCVVVSPSTGQILAMATVPSYNPNVISERRITRNYTVTDVFEPGSTAKTFAVAKALIDGWVTPSTMIDTSPGFMRIGGFTVEDIRNFGSLTVEDVIMKSSNIGIIKIGTQVAPNDLADFYRSLGFSEVTGSGILGEHPGLFPERTKWRKNEHATLTYGYGFAITAMQMVRAYSAIANGGSLIPLTIFPNQEPSEAKQVMPQSIATELTRMLERVVTPTGTSRRAKVQMYRIAGKTATVQKLINGRYSSQQHLAMFAGFAPASNPKLAAVIIVDNPRGKSHYGGYVAAPAFREIMTSTLRLLNVPPDDFSQFVKKETVETTSAES